MPMSDCLGAMDAFEQFRVCCSQRPECVGVGYEAMKFARSIGLKSDADFKAFVADDGLELVFPQDIDEWRNNPWKGKLEIWAYAFGCFSGDKFLYLAILHPHLKSEWWVKSFKDNSQPPSQMQKALLQAQRRRVKS